jgi:hypothetical protein
VFWFTRGVRGADRNDVTHEPVNPRAHTHAAPPIIVDCPACERPNRIPQEATTRLRCGACRIKFADWLRDAMADPSPYWRGAAVYSLASLYEPSLFSLLVQALADRDGSVRAAAWKALAYSRTRNTEAGDPVTLPPLYDRISAAERVELCARVPRVAELDLADAQPRAKTQTARPPDPERHVSATPQNASPAAPRSDPAARRDGLTLAELAAEARLLARQLGEFA